MCLPLIPALAVAAVGLGVVQTGMGMAAASKNAKSQRAQLAAQAETARQNSELAKLNAAAATEAATTNSANLLKLTEINATSRQAITDINVALADSISNFNLEVADGNAKILLGQGELVAGIAERNAGISRRSAAQEEENAQQSLEVGKKEEQGSRLNYARLKSTQRATLAANGVALDEGSALRIQTDTDYFSDVDADMIHANAVRGAMGYRQKADNFMVQAQSDEISADVARLNARTEAAAMKAQAFGAKMAADRDVLNMKLSTSFEILQARSNAAIESANLLNQGRIEATNYEMQAAGFSNQAQSALSQRKGISPFFDAASAGIAGAASVASKWYGYQKAGVFG